MQLFHPLSGSEQPELESRLRSLPEESSSVVMDRSSSNPPLVSEEHLDYPSRCKVWKSWKFDVITIVKSLATAIAKYLPHSLINMISNPVNSTVPIAAVVFKKAGTYDEKRLFGVTTLDVVRAKTFYRGKAKVPVADVNVPVIGGLYGVWAGFPCDIVKSLATAIAKYFPHALINMISNPVNSTVPIVAVVFKKAGTYDEKSLFGVTTLDVVRAKTFYRGKAKVPVADVNVPVIGGLYGFWVGFPCE
ncbi:hypothetical protein KIW84_022944 [Lathyrus oleraceus]|uniref:Malate dehydrogenase n=2 Tax=Pisum sativum TaxID=3888 RepID=A0A9D4YEA7_PEA|nr:hypothetical protein KIW84_022944 [Pisum sativum]